MSADSLTKAILRLFESERFYGELIMQMDRKITKSIDTAGVRIKDRIELFVNLEFFDKLTPAEQVAVLKHECQHILHDHIPRSREVAPDVYSSKKRDLADAVIDNMKHRFINVACDLSINPGIPNIPSLAVMPALYDLPDGETMEWYHENLKKSKKAKDWSDYDGHPLWDDSEESTDALRQKIRNAVNEAAQNTRSAGKMSSDDELLVSKLNASSRDWRAELKRFVARQVEYFIESSRKKRNRRYGISIPGDIKIERLKLGVAIDTSGSVSDEALTQFMSEIAEIAKYATVTVVEADAEVKNSYVFDPKKKYSIKGRGGTAYQPAFDWFNKQRIAIDGLIYFGDMDCYDNEEIKRPNYPVLWAIVGTQKPPVSWGSSINIEVKP